MKDSPVIVHRHEFAPVDRPPGTTGRSTGFPKSAANIDRTIALACGRAAERWPVAAGRRRITV